LNLQVFCYVGLLRFSEQLEPALALLPDAQREEATKFLETVKGLPKAELIQRWAMLREDESAVLRRTAHDRAGLELDELAPSVRAWCVSWIADQHG
jgi:hypothetical protein